MRAIVVGPLPPPVDGRAVATEWLVDALRARGWQLAITDTQVEQPRFAVALKLLRCLRSAVAVLVSSADIVLVVASGGSGLIAETAPLFAGRLRRRDLFLVHHSSSYVRRRSPLMRAAITAGGPRLRHVVLSRAMGTMLAAQYGLSNRSWVELDNAALMPETAPPAGVGSSRSVLHLSHLTVEKGVLVVLDVARRIPAFPGKPTVRLAGTLTDEVREQVTDALRAGLVEHLGQIAGEEKFVEMSRSRVFLFPSGYRHEAQPLVVYEAAEMGAVPVVWASGWIPQQMAALGLERYVFEPGNVDGLVTATSDLLAMSDDEFAALSEQVRGAFAAHRERVRLQLDQLLAR